MNDIKNESVNSVELHSSEDEVRRITEKLNSSDAAIKDPAKRREIIKTLLIIFLAALLLLTFFSNTIMNRALAEISTERVTAGELTERIRGSGMVEAEQSYEVSVDENRTVDKINIKAGQKVVEGDVLFVLGSGQEQSLTAAENELATLELEYNKLLLTAPADYTSENQEIKNAAEDLEEAIRRRDAAYAAQNSSAEAQEQYKADKNEAANLSAQRDKLSSTIGAIDSDDYTAAAAELTGDLATMRANWQAAESEYAAAYEVYKSAVESGDAESALADCNAKNEKRTSAKTAYELKKSSVRAELASRLNDAETKLSEVNSRIASYEENTQSGGISYEDCAADVQAKQRTLENLRISLTKLQNTNSITQQQYELDLENKRDTIEKKKQELEKLRGSSSSLEIVSKYSGTVRSVSVKPADMTAAGVPLAVIDLDDAGFRLSVDVPAEQAKKVSNGTVAQVINNWSGDAKAVLAEIKNSGADANTMTLVFNISGSVTASTNMEISIPLSRDQYQAIVPKSAVFSDQNGSFVYKLRSKNTPLGNRYYAERVSVQVSASDESSSAVSGELTNSDTVIVAFSKPITAGDQVRLKSKDKV